MATTRLAAAGAIKGAFEDLCLTSEGQASLAVGLAAMGVHNQQLQQVIFVGDSMTAGNLFAAPITSASRVNGVVTIITSSDPGIVSGLYGNTINIVPEDMNANAVVFTKTATNTFTYPSPGADATGTALSASKPMQAQNPQQQFDYVSFWAKSKTSGAFRVKRIYGNNGNTAADNLRKAQTGQISFSGGTVAILQTGYNDFVTEARTAEAVLADMTALAELAKAGGCRRVVIEGALPWMTGGSNTNRGEAARYNRLMMNYCAAVADTRYANSAALLVDGTHATAFYPKANMLNTDGIHPSPIGAERRAQAIYDATSDWFPAVDRLVCSAADNIGFNAASLNICNSGPWADTGGTVTSPATGVAAPLVTVTTNASVTTVASVPARADGIGYDQQIESTSAGTSITATIAIGSFAASLYAPGEKYIFSAELSLSGITGSTLRGINMSLSTVSEYIIRSGATDAARYPQDDMTIKIFSNPIVIPESEPANFSITTAFIFNAAGTALTAKLGRMSLERVVE